MRSMRSVWLSMRDEEPPTSGLTELLAAARTKAEAMQPREPWWRRAMLAMRRPPALALASVIVLVGGAVWISGRRESLEVTPVVSVQQERAAGEKLDEPAGAAPDEKRTRSGDRDGYAGTVATPTAPAPTGSAAATPPPPGATTIRPPVAPARRPPAVRPPPTEGAPAPVAPDPARVDGENHVPASQTLEIAGSGSGAPARTWGREADGRPPAADDGASVVDTVAVESTSVARGPRTAPSASLDQLAKQSQTAAARGDCAAVRVIVGRIRKLDATFHKDHVANNAAVARCVK